MSGNMGGAEMGGEDMGLRELYRDQPASQTIVSAARLRRKQELQEIEQLGIVGSDSRRRTIRHHISNHLTRMTNHRLMILPHGGGRELGRKKSSVLVTSMEDTEMNDRELFLQQSRTLVGKFIQVHSHNQRVLQKLGSEEFETVVRHGEYLEHSSEFDVSCSEGGGGREVGDESEGGGGG